MSDHPKDRTMLVTTTILCDKFSVHPWFLLLSQKFVFSVKTVIQLFFCFLPHSSIFQLDFLSLKASAYNLVDTNFGLRCQGEQICIFLLTLRDSSLRLEAL